MRFIRVILAILAVLLVIALVVAWTLPAQLAWRYAAPRLPALQMQGVEGSVWHGSAARVSVVGQPLGQLEWSLAVMPLLHGVVQADVLLAGDMLNASGRVSRQLDGAIDIERAHVEASAAPLQQALGLGSVQPLGELVADIPTARVRNAWFEALGATAHWRGAGVTGSTQAMFGDISAIFSLDDTHRVHADIHDDGKGPLRVGGQFLAEPGGYSLEVRMAARQADDWQTQEALQHLGQRQSDGSVVLKVEGRMLGVSLP